MKIYLKCLIILCFIATIMSFRVKRDAEIKDIEAIKKEVTEKAKNSLHSLPKVKLSGADWLLFSFHHASNIESEFKCWYEKTKTKTAEKRSVNDEFKKTFDKLKEIKSKNKITQQMLDGPESKQLHDGVKQLAKEILDAVKPLEAKITDFEKSSGVNCYKRAKRLFVQKTKKRANLPRNVRRFGVLVRGTLEVAMGAAVLVTMYEAEEISNAAYVYETIGIGYAFYEGIAHLKLAWNYPEDIAQVHPAEP